MIRILFLLIFLIPSKTAISQTELIGNWKRVQDESTNEKELFEGNVLELKEVENNLIGKLIKITPDAKRYGYKLGHVKWKNFQNISDDKYLIELLLMDVDNDFEFRKKVYLKANLFLKDPNTILIRIGEHPRVFSGKIQKFIRVSEDLI